MGHCGAVRFIWMEIEGHGPGPDVPSLSAPQWEKSNLTFIRPRNRARIQAFCATGAAHVSVPGWLSLLLHGTAPGHAVCCEPQEAARVTCLWRQNS